MSTRIRIGLIFGLTVAMIGCLANDRTMITVGGTVQFDGSPVEEGQILFRRTSGEQRGYETTIRNGVYELKCEPGEVRVEITAYRPVPGKFTTVNGPREPVTEMYIPAKYNINTELVRSVEQSSKAVDFDLTSKD